MVTGPVVTRRTKHMLLDTNEDQTMRYIALSSDVLNRDGSLRGRQRLCLRNELFSAAPHYFVLHKIVGSPT